VGTFFFFPIFDGKKRTKELRLIYETYVEKLETTDQYITSRKNINYEEKKKKKKRKIQTYVKKNTNQYINSRKFLN